MSKHELMRWVLGLVATLAELDPIPCELDEARRAVITAGFTSEEARLVVRIAMRMGWVIETIEGARLTSEGRIEGGIAYLSLTETGRRRGRSTNMGLVQPERN